MIKRKEAKLDLDLSKDDVLIPISKELKTKFLLEEVVKLCAEYNYKHIYNEKKDTIIISTFNEKLGEEFEKELTKRMVNLGDFLEKETGKNRKKFNRTITLFENSIDLDSVKLYW